MTEELTDTERQALEWLRDGEYDRFRGAPWWVREDLAGRGLVLLARSRTDERYGITDRGLAALDAPRRD
jgi:hypothetical protein